MLIKQNAIWYFDRRIEYYEDVFSLVSTLAFWLHARNFHSLIPLSHLGNEAARKSSI